MAGSREHGNTLPAVATALIVAAAIGLGLLYGVGAAAADGSIDEMDTTNVTDNDGDGNKSNFDVVVEADTRVWEFEQVRSSGEPMFTVTVGNETVRKGVERDASGRYVIPIDGRDIANESKLVRIQVDLVDVDYGDNAVRAEWSKVVRYEPASKDYTEQELARRGIESLVPTYTEYETRWFNADYWESSAWENADRAAKAASPIPPTKRGAAIDLLTRASGVGGAATTTWSTVETGVWGGISYVEGKMSDLLTLTNGYGEGTYHGFRTDLKQLAQNTRDIRNAETKTEVRELVSTREQLLRDLYRTEQIYRINTRSLAESNSGGLLGLVQANEHDYDLFKSEFDELETHLIADYYWTQIYLNSGADDYTNLTEAVDDPPTLSPDPDITAVSVPESTTVGDSVEVTVKVTNDGVDAPFQSIAVSAPDAEAADAVSITETDFENQGYQTVFAPGEEVGSSYGQDEVSLSYPLAEVGGSWESDERKSMTVEVTPQTSGEYTLYVKSVAQDGGWAGAPAIESDGPTDQQSERVEAYTLSVEARNEPPTAVLDASPSTPTTEDSVTFDASESTDPDGTISEYVWDFDGDGRSDETTTTPTVTHSYGSAGTYTAEVTVVDNDDDSATATQTVTVDGANEAPTAAFSVSPQQARPGTTLTFDASASTDPDGSIASYGWDFDGDGTTDRTTSDATVTHSYGTAGTYTPELVVTDADGSPNATTETVTITANAPPRAVLAVDAHNPSTGTQITFDASDSADDDGSIRTYFWDFDGDGTAERTTSDATVTHSYGTAGTYAPVVTVQDDGGTNATATVNLRVNARPTPRISTTPANPAKGESVTLSAAGATDADGSIVSYEWTVDGEGVGSGETATTTFGEVGTYEVSLTVTDNDGATSATSETITASSDRVRWRYETGARVESSPTVVDGTVYIGSKNGRLYALAAESGARDWQTKLAPGIDSAPTAVDGTVYVGGTGALANFYAVNAETGQKQWQSDRWLSSLDGFESPTFDDGTVYAASEDGFSAFDATTGEELWDVTLYAPGLQTETEPYQASPTLVGNTVYTGSENGTVYALNATNGEVRWEYDTGMDVDSSPTVADGTIYVGSHNGNIYALDAATGTKQWTFESGANTIWSSPTVEEGTVYIGTGNGDLYGSGEGSLYALDSETGTKRWQVDTGSIGSSSPTVVDETVYIGTLDGTLHAIDTSGDTQWTVDIGGGIQSSPTVVDGTLYVGSRNGAVYAVETDQSGSSEGSRARLGTLGHHNTFAEEGPPEPETNIGPTARPSFTPSQPTTGDWLVFSGFESSDPDGEIASYEWSFDGREPVDTVWGVGSGWFTDHHFESVGEHTVTLTVTDDDGASDTVSRTIPVTAGSDDTASVEVADLELRLQNITECGFTCRSTTYELENPTDEPVSDLTADIDVVSGGKTLIETEQAIGDVAAGETVTFTDRIEADQDQVTTILDNDGRVTLELQLQTANTTRTITFDREF